MKKSLILVMLSACALTMSAFTSNIPEVEVVAQFDKSTMISKKLRSAQESMDKGDYQAAINTLNSLLKLSPNHSKAKEMLDQCKQGIKQQKAREEQAFKDACKSGSIDALNGFISRYPNSEYVKSARQRLDDYSIWEIAKKRNTIDSYNLYLQKSTVLAYKEDAQAAIKKIKADQAWSVCMNTENESLLNDFISTYPESPNIGEARYRLNLLKGERMYRDGFTDMAYSYLGDANLHRTLTGEAAAHYAELKDKKTFNEMLASSDIDKVRKYLNTLSFSSPYYNDTSNHLALLLGAKLGAWSSESSMNEALAFAKDESTRATVRKYINQAKDLHKTYEHQRKARARKAWWKNNFKIGVDADFGTNLDSEAGADMFYSVGLVGRFGSYRQSFNFVTGVKYRWLRVMPEYDSYYDDHSTDWQLFGGAVCIPLNFRFNVAEVSQRSRVYLAIGGEYGYIFEEKNKSGVLDHNYVSLFPQFGITSPNFDLSCYIKSYLLGPFKKDSKNKSGGFDCSCLLGLQMAVYF
jgi:outer membrane protein assembly factor BamD (BamD/ComL family)